jgi:hypothetical protein
VGGDYVIALWPLSLDYNMPETQHALDFHLQSFNNYCPLAEGLQSVFADDDGRLTELQDTVDAALTGQDKPALVVVRHELNMIIGATRLVSADPVLLEPFERTRKRIGRVKDRESDKWPVDGKLCVAALDSLIRWSPVKFDFADSATIYQRQLDALNGTTIALDYLETDERRKNGDLHEVHQHRKAFRALIVAPLVMAASFGLTDESHQSELAFLKSANDVLGPLVDSQRPRKELLSLAKNNSGEIRTIRQYLDDKTEALQIGG